MWRVVVFFICLLLPSVVFSSDNGVDAKQNMSVVEEKISTNDLKFDNLLTELKKRYKDFDWKEFKNLDPDTQRIVITNYLAREAFSEVIENFKKDIYSRTKNEITIEEDDNHIYYFNTSDLLYKNAHNVTENIMKEAEKKGLLHKTDGAQWKHFKQQDVPELDKLILKHTEKSTADVTCDKWCAMPRNRIDEDWRKNYLVKIKDLIDKYEQVSKKILQDEEDKLEELKKTNSNNKEGLKLIKTKQKDLKAQKQQLEEEITKQKKDYERQIEIQNSIDIVWDLNPYRSDCEMVKVSCFNVEQIPIDHERMELSITKPYNGSYSVMYTYDDLSKNEHISSLALQNCNCDEHNDITRLVNCHCSIGFYDTITDYDRYRKYENQDRIDIKKGKLQDVTDDGIPKHEWPGDLIPIGRISNRTMYLDGHHEK